ncbi:MAG: hypothetical protein KBF99_07955 [Leptospiraceae bacterium]|nr:hypothetical protein [Leptospiraceae bacterium]MBK9500676.1 hypothetical protein [Leptospiraceae bacterium]MBL0267061.1 hypothetical protein [Leptospiraceae bacterium]MBP9163101.1 hypothetical protein [Leptospiraceae bacterium]
MKISQLHKLGGILAILIILFFQVLTISSEFSGDFNRIITAKQIIAWLIPFLVITLIGTGISGRKLAGKSTNILIIRKQSRMKFIAANGILILLPSAYILLYLSKIQPVTNLFWILQTLEISSGLINLTLLILNAKDGIARRLERAK